MQQVSQHINLEFIDRLIKEVDYKDKDITERLHEGFRERLKDKTGIVEIKRQNRRLKDKTGIILFFIPYYTTTTKHK